MRHIVFSQEETYPIVLLIKDSALAIHEIDATYVQYLESHNIPRSSILIAGLPYQEGNKATVKFIKEQLDILMPELKDYKTQYIYCADAKYFKVLTGCIKAEVHLGYAMKCNLKGYEHIEIVLGVNHKSLMYNANNEPKLSLSLETLMDLIKGNYTGLGLDIIKHAQYPCTEHDIAHTLNTLLQYPSLAVDVETFSLHHDTAGIATITFCPDHESGIAFACDYTPYEAAKDGLWGEYAINYNVRYLIQQFLIQYEGTLIFHNATFDIKMLIAALWTKNNRNTLYLLDGLDILTRKIHDTKIIAYLALNSCAGNKLSLKDLAHEFAGNWAQSNITDIRKIPLPTLLEYNLVDGLATNYVFHKYYPTIVETNQEKLYTDLLLPSVKLITQMELTGIPLNQDEVAKAKVELRNINNLSMAALQSSPIILKFEESLRQSIMDTANAKLKKKVHPISAYSHVRYNPGSAVQTRRLLYNEMELPIQYYTKKKQASTKAKHLVVLKNHTTDPEKLRVLDNLIDYSLAAKILSSFIPAFEKAVKDDDISYLHGSFKIGGTISGRLSSSDPNLQNLPVKKPYGKLMKNCFQAPKGWLMVGADFNSLEDMISALTTKDKNKLKVYEQGYDGHSLRAYSYFGAEMPDIVNTIESINSIETLYPELRQDSKAPTFALTYGGMESTLIKNLGWSKEKAEQVAKNYHDLYAESDIWVADKLNQASRDGFVTCAFGLRLRTPLLKATIRGLPSTPFEAEAEARSAGNALGQSYGLLNNRAAIAFMQEVWKSPYRYDIKPIALIHDAIYLIVKDNSDIIAWVNVHLINAMKWQELPEIQHDTVKLGAELAIYWPSWAYELKLPNDANSQIIEQLCKEYRHSLEK